ncbi:MAG: surface lipoprotein assembly modifier [Rhodoferax sp.]|nr:surface lipoprotein assembly modifier [Rhodoferax sp.]
MHLSPISVGKLLRPVWIAAVAVLLVVPSAQAQVAQSALEQADALIKAGNAEAAYQLLEPLEIQGAGDSVYDYLLGTAALDSNRPSKATFVYERILAVTPDYVGIRADMGRAYFALGDFGRAKIEFETVLTFQNLPQDLRTTVEQYVKAAEARAQDKATVFNGYAEFGLGHDTNIGSANAASSLNYPGSALTGAGTYAPDLKSDSYATLGLGGELNHRFNAQWGLYAGADYRGRAYSTYCDNTCNGSLDARLGASYSGGAWLLRGGMIAGNYTLNQAIYRDTTGLSVDWRLAMPSGSQFSLGASGVQTQYLVTGQSSQNTQTNTLNIGWLTSLGDGDAVFSLSASGGVELAVGGRDDGHREFAGPRILLQKSLNNTLGAYLSAGATMSRYGGINTLYGISREESLYDIALGMTWSLRKGLSLRPQLSYLKNVSNAELYSYDKTDASINLRLDY